MKFIKQDNTDYQAEYVQEFNRIKTTITKQDDGRWYYKIVDLDSGDYSNGLWGLVMWEPMYQGANGKVQFGLATLREAKQWAHHDRQELMNK